jgi:hypothetical protein
VPGIQQGVEMAAEYHPEKAQALGIAPRFGWHSGAIPYAEQFNVKVRPEDLVLGLPEDAVGQRILQPADMVWSEVAVPEGRDYTSLVENMETVMGRPRKPWTMGLDESEHNVAFMPRDGHYYYDPPNRGKRGGDPWLISDKITHTRLISDDEVDEILISMNRPELAGRQRKGGRWDEKRLREAFPSWFASGASTAVLMSGAFTPADDVEAANLTKFLKHVDRPAEERDEALIAGSVLGAPLGLEAYAADSEQAFPLLEQRLRDMGLLP